MPKFEFTKKAVEDLTQIWEYTIEEWSEEQADRYYKILISDCEFIAKHPDIGKKYDSILVGLRGFKSIKHIIFYRPISKNLIEISRILHERMDIDKRIEE